MADFSINEMQEMQRRLQDKYKDKWEPVCPEAGKNKLLWMLGEIGEVIDIIKKHGGTKASADVDVRKELVEELADVLMYYNDILLCYNISAEELKQAYSEKFQKKYEALVKSNCRAAAGTSKVACKMQKLKHEGIDIFLQVA